MIAENNESTRSTVAFTPILVACLGLAAGPERAEEPEVKSGKIDSKIIHIGALPRAPRVTLDLRGKAQDVTLVWSGPAGLNLADSFDVIEGEGRQVFDGSSNVSTPFSPYAAAGTWTLTDIEVCSRECTNYNGASLAALFPSLTLTVVNPNSDATPPVASAASVTTPTVVASNEAEIGVALTLQDNYSGVTTAQVEFSDRKGHFERNDVVVGRGLDTAVTASTTLHLTSYCRCAKNRAGVYTAIRVFRQDAAGNQTSITDPDALSALFGGQDTVTITN